MSEMRSDADLVTAHVAGDRSALAGIYQRYGATLFDTAAAMLGDRDEAADVTQDVFLVSAERLGQLRDPTRLKPWLFAVLRNEVYRRTKKRRRTIVTDFSEPAAAMVLPPAAEGVSEQVDELVSGDELAELVRGAARGLDERDQLVLELAVRQNLEGTDLADALGVSAQQSYGLVHRMRERTERSLAAFCVARAGRRDCDELDAILRNWDGEFTVLIRKRVARHIDSCETCERTRRKVAPLALFGAAPAFAAPPDLWDRISERLGLGTPDEPPYGFEASGGFPGMVRARRGAVLWLGATAALVVLLVVGIVAGVAVSRDAGTVITADGATTTLGGAGATTAALATTDAAGTNATPDATTSTTSPTGTPISTTSSTSTSSTSTSSTVATPSSTTSPTTIAPLVVPVSTAAPRSTTPPLPPPPPPASLSLSAGRLDFGSAASSANVTLSNRGGSTATWALTGSDDPFRIAPTNGSLAPGASVVLAVTLDRTPIPEGSTPAASVSFTAFGSAPAPLSMSASTVRRPPVIQLVSAPGARFCASARSAQVLARVTDESPVTVVSSWTKPDGTTGSQPMSLGSAGTWSASFPVARSEIGRWTWQITATDALGNRSTLPGRFDVAAC